jgi:hypothetical protein
MVLGLTSGNSFTIFFVAALVLYVYLWLHDKEKAMSVTRGIGMLIVGVFKMIFRFFEGIFRLIFR